MAMHFNEAALLFMLDGGNWRSGNPVQRNYGCRECESLQPLLFGLLSLHGETEAGSRNIAVR
jgi:hypothetical protein